VAERGSAAGDGVADVADGDDCVEVEEAEGAGDEPVAAPCGAAASGALVTPAAADAGVPAAGAADVWAMAGVATISTEPRHSIRVSGIDLTIVLS
jgi:hypothetical protein